MCSLWGARCAVRGDTSFDIIVWNSITELSATKVSFSHFCRAMICISTATAVMRCLSVRLSVMFVDHVKTNKHVFEIFSPSDSHTILVFPHQTGWRYSDGNPPNGGVECRWGIGRNRDSDLIAGYRRFVDVRTTKWQSSYRRPCSVDRTVGDAPANVCLWWPAAWTNTPKRREQKIF